METYVLGADGAAVLAIPGAAETIEAMRRLDEAIRARLGGEQ